MNADATSARRTRREPWVLLASGALLLIASALEPRDYPTWALEVLPILIAVPVLLATARGFPLTPLAYRLIFLHALVLMYGAHYTYAEVPLGNWARDLFDFGRNPYDRLGHFMQGFVPAVIAREILLRRSPLTRGKWLFFIVAAICLALSACYEFIEWWTALAAGTAADAFLGTQGDVWDTQWDMLMALTGAVISQWLLASHHDRQLAALR